jgi:hypothetical protein
MPRILYLGLFESAGRFANCQAISRERSPPKDQPLDEIRQNWCGQARFLRPSKALLATELQHRVNRHRFRDLREGAGFVTSTYLLVECLLLRVIFLQ